MSKRTTLDRFEALAGNLPTRDQRDLWERPFFSLAKTKRVNPILYPAGDNQVRIYAVPEHGTATIWDADVLSCAASGILAAEDRRLPTARNINHVAHDGTPSIAALSLLALAADVVLVPTQPPPFDGLAFAETLRLVNEMTIIIRPQLRPRLVFNPCDVRGHLTQSAQALTDCNTPVLTSQISQPAVFAAAAKDGRLVFEMADNEEATREITTLATEVERIAR